MPEPMLKFVDRPRETPEKRAAADRVRDFDEIYRRYADDKAAEQAARCSQCGVPFCQHHCPLGNNIPDWLRLISEGRVEEAYRASAETNAMPEVCGRICPQDRLCEGSCVIEQSEHGTVTIGSVEAYLTDKAWENGWVRPLAPARERAASVGVVGAGPAGLAAADRLRSAGYRVVVYDRYDRAGGLLIYGIPNFKLDKSIVAKRVDRLRAGGVTFELGVSLGEDVTLSELRARHDAVLLATGVYAARSLSCPGAGGPRVVEALNFLTASNRRGLGDYDASPAPELLDARGKRVVVVGGGDTAMDCVRTAVRQGARSVTCLYRRDRENMPGSQREVGHAEEEGVVFDWLSAPLAVTTGGVRAARMRLAGADASGRKSPEPIEGADFEIPADMIVKALGFEAEDADAVFGDAAPKTTSRGTLVVDGATMQTSLPGVYAAGDIVRGASLVVWAIRDGMLAAEAIDAQLTAAEATPRRAAPAPLMTA
ncbi:MAG: NAD(P)-dependent oxidoreductase [Pseudomonadota bacterium]